MKIKVTRSNYDEIKGSMREFLIEEIEGFIKQSGGQRELSLSLGREEKFVNTKYRRGIRGSFSGLEKLWRECREKIDSGNHG